LKSSGPPSPPFPLSALAASRLCAALDTSTLLVVLFDPDDRLVHANRAYAEAFLDGLAPGVSFPDILRHGFHRGFGVRIDCGDVEAFLADILPRRRLQPARTITTDLVDGRWLLFTQTLLDDGWLLDVGTDISQLKQHEHRIAQAHASAVQEALTDPLTGVSNRRHIVDLAEAALLDFQRERRPMCVALLDMDHFKVINDTQGHHVGDEVLVQFCEQCRHHLRPTDALGRFGGEEFLLVLRDVAPPAAMTVLERLREAVRGGGPIPYTFSGGLAEAQPGETLGAVLRRADAALYAAKAAGRDRCLLAEPG
jgi:diguanylate cyclase (GGDEF)-like protein